MALVAWVSFWHVVILALHISSLWWEFRVALVVSSNSRATFISPCSQSTSSGRSVGLAPGELKTVDRKRYQPHPGFQHSMWGRWVTDLNSARDVFWHNLGWGHLWGCSHWIRNGWAYPLQAEWIFHSAGGQSTQGHRGQLPFRHATLKHAMLRGRGWGCGRSLLQLFQASKRCWLGTTVMSCRGLTARRG